MSDLNQEILDFTRRRLSLIRDSKGTWPFAASLKRLSGQTVHEYEDRFLLELLQNAYDAQPAAATDGRVHMVLSRRDTEPVLYVANTGRPFRKKDLEAISNLALSSKGPGEGIGNKGLGFRSVLRVSEWPEVFSTNPAGNGAGLGYCFGFARPEDLADLSTNLVERAQLERDVPPSALPVPRPLQDPWITRLLDLGFVTVIRLPLTRASAFDLVVERLLSLKDRKTPPLLFLDRLASVEVVFDAVDEHDFCLTRETTPAPLDGPGDVKSTRVSTGGLTYLVFEEEIEADAMLAAIERSIQSGDLSEEWRGWEGLARVGLAVPLDGVVEGRIYTHLPMSTASPINGHVNAPFYTKLARLEANLQVGLNTFLMDQVAKLAAITAHRIVGSTASTWRRVAVDLLSWDEKHGEGFRRNAEALTGIPKVPSLVGSKREWSPISDVMRWPEAAGQQFFNPGKVSGAGRRGVLDPDLGCERQDRLEQTAKGTWGVDLTPGKEEAGEIAEHIAAQVLGKRTVKKWNEFYRELAMLARLLGGDILRRRALLIDQSGKLRRCGPWDDVNRAGKPVFLPPTATDDDRPIILPASLATVVPMLHPEVELRRQEGAVRVRTEISEVLRQADLVREYKKEHVLAALADASLRARGDSRRMEILEQLFRIFAADPRTDAFRNLSVMVPTREGWLPCSQAIFGEGWVGTLGPKTASVLAAVKDDRLLALSRRLLTPPDSWPFSDSQQALLAHFLQTVGVADGLKPDLVEMLPIREPGSFWVPVKVAARLPIADTEKAFWVLAGTREQTGPNHPYTPYRSEKLWDLPGFLEIQELPSELRLTYARLIAESIGKWPGETMDFRFHRYQTHHRNSTDPQKWPSPAAALLSEVPWIPVRGPGRRDEVEFVRPREAWYFDDRDRRAPAFATLIDDSIARVLEQSAASHTRLGRLGIKRWTDPGAAHHRLGMLADLAERGDVRESDIDALKKALRDAFRECLDHNLLNAESRIVVQRGHRLDLAGSHETVYLPADPPGFVDHLLESLDLPVAIVGQTDPAEVSAHAPELAERLRRGSELTVEVEASGNVVRPDVEHPTLLNKAPWLVEWLLLTSELSRNKFLRMGSRALEEMVADLRRVRLVTSSTVRVRVDGKHVRQPPHLSGCIPLHDDLAPTLVAEAADEMSDSLCWTLVADASDALAELLHQPRMASELRLSATEAKRVTADEFRRLTVGEWAQALRAPEQRIREVLARAHAHEERIHEFLVPVLYVFEGPGAAARLQSLESPTLADLTAELQIEVGEDETERLLEEAQRAESLAALRDSLKLDFKGFNMALRDLGSPYEPIHSPDEHRRVIDGVLSRFRPQIAEAVRVRYLEAFDSLGDLQPYVSLRQGPHLDPAPEDLEAYASPPEAVVLARIDAWLSDQGCPRIGEGGKSLPPLTEVRALNLNTARRFLAAASPVFQAWERKAGTDTEASRAAASDDGTASLEAGGWLDFRVIDSNDLPGLLARVGHWPSGMPWTCNLEQLGLTEEDVSRAREVEATEKQERRRRQSTIVIGREEVDAEDLANVAEVVDRTLDDLILETSKRQSFPMAPESGKSNRTTPGRSGPYRGSRGMTDAQLIAIGLAGELIAFRWLQAQYEEANEESWVSGNRAVLLGGEGDDSLGYDFIVHQRSQSVRFEVKATAGEDTAFTLTENEMRVAQSATTRMLYRIIFIRNVLTPGEQRLDILPNPVGPEGSERYRMTGQGVTFAFVLDPG